MADRPLQGRHLLTLEDYSPDEIRLLLDRAHEAKKERAAGERRPYLERRSIATIFLKPSTRSRMSLVVAAQETGALAEVFRSEDIRFGEKESLADIARVTGRLFDAIAFRGHDHAEVEELARFAGIPVLNCLTEQAHPTQALADLMTLEEAFGGVQGLPVAYVGDGRNNVSRSLAHGLLKLGGDLRIVAPQQLQFDEDEQSRLETLAGSHGGSFTQTTDRSHGLDGAAAVYTDVWVSMGEEALLADRQGLLEGYAVTTELMNETHRSDTIFLHCLPALHDDATTLGREHPGIREVADEVFEGEMSRVFDQAENRMHTIKAILIELIG